MTCDASDENDPVAVARAIYETLAFAPIGLGAKLVDDAPEVVRRVRQELNNARFIGRMAVEQGTARLREQVQQTDRAEVPSAHADLVDAAAGGGPAPSLPIADYDELPAIEIVALLDALTPAERRRIAEHESANRRRRTVLGKIDQLVE